MDAMEVKISDRQAHVPNQLALNADAALLDVRLRIVSGKQVETRRLGAHCRRRCKDGWISQARIRYQRTVKRHAGYLDSILRVRRAEHDGGGAAKEYAIATAEDGLFI